jgi:hypothetical protein
MRGSSSSGEVPFFQSAVERIAIARTKMIAGLMGPKLLAIGIAMVISAAHLPEMAQTNW